MAVILNAMRRCNDGFNPAQVDALWPNGRAGAYLHKLVNIAARKSIELQPEASRAQKLQSAGDVVKRVMMHHMNVGSVPANV